MEADRDAQAAADGERVVVVLDDACGGELVLAGAAVGRRIVAQDTEEIVLVITLDDQLGRC